jgi:hypothetical protein
MHVFEETKKTIFIYYLRRIGLNLTKKIELECKRDKYCSPVVRITLSEAYKKRDLSKFSQLSVESQKIFWISKG